MHYMFKVLIAIIYHIDRDHQRCWVSTIIAMVYFVHLHHIFGVIHWWCHDTKLVHRSKSNPLLISLALKKRPTRHQVLPASSAGGVPALLAARRAKTRRYLIKTRQWQRHEQRILGVSVGAPPLLYYAHEQLLQYTNITNYQSSIFNIFRVQYSISKWEWANFCKGDPFLGINGWIPD